MKQDTTRKISSSHHLRLATEIYQLQNQQDDLLSLLQNPKVGIDSPVGMGDGEFIRCEMKLLKETKQYDRLLEQCHNRLQQLITAKESNEAANIIDPLSGADDWFVWECLLLSSRQSSKAE